jgi:hypothetical protein
MEWYSKITRRDDPNILSYKARKCVAFHFLIVGLILMFNVGTLHTLAACGIVFGVFGAGVLWWETVAKDPDLQSVISEIVRIGSSTKLSFVDRGYVAILYQLAIVFFFFFGGLIYLIGTHNPNQLRLSPLLAVVVLFAFYVCAPMGLYVLIKLTRRWGSRWLKRIRASQDQNAEIKTFLRFIGFVSLWAAGFLQLPATLVSPH